MKKLIKYIICFIVFISIKEIEAKGQYAVFSYSSNDINYFEDSREAYDFYYDNFGSNANLVLTNNNKVEAMKYGVLYFKNELIQYYSLNRHCDDYLDGQYFADGVYLSSDNNDDTVKFMINGEIGEINKDEVTLIPFDQLDIKVSSYETKDNKLYHNIKTQLLDEYFTYSIYLGGMPSYLENNKLYFSYDGHYFYNSFYSMVDDYRANTYNNSLNSGTPYYNYYLYLPAHNISNYLTEEVENYFYNDLNMNSTIETYFDKNNDGVCDYINRSMLYNNIGDFFINQNKFGVNGLYSLAVSINDSSYGRSKQAYQNNNVFLHSVYDLDTERENDCYTSVSKSIYSFDKYFINKLYSNYNNKNYYGTHLGNKKSGINIEYSLDPYFGEKCAANYLMIDDALGNKDLNNYCLGIVDGLNSLTFYEDKELKKAIFTINDVKDLSLLIVQDCNNAYKVQADYCFSNDYKYDFDLSTLYVNSKDVKYLINQDKIHSIQLEDSIINDDIEFVKDDSKKKIIEYDEISFEDIRAMDKKALENNIFGYHIGDNNLDISISGLASGLDFPIYNLIFGDTFYANIEENVTVKDDFINMVKGYGFDIEYSFAINFKLNYFKQELKKPIIINSKISHKDYKAYSVYHINDDGDIEKCETTWSNNYVCFICYESGQYIVLSRDSFNNYDLIDYKENINVDNNSIDNHKFIRESLIYITLIIIGLISCTIYFSFYRKMEKQWRDYRKSLLTAESVQEEKLKN